LSTNPNITIEFVKENLNLSWNWRSLSLNPNITFDYIKENLDKDWNWDYFIFNKFNKHRIIKKRLSTQINDIATRIINS